MPESPVTAASTRFGCTAEVGAKVVGAGAEVGLSGAVELTGTGLRVSSTVTCTVPMAVAPLRSVTVYRKASWPEKPNSGS